MEVFRLSLRSRLDELAQLQNHSDAKRIRDLASAALRLKTPWDSAPALTASEALARMVIYPSGRTLDPELAQRLLADLDDPGRRHFWTFSSDFPMAGLFVHLSANESGPEEFVLLYGGSGWVYQRGSGGWREVGQVSQSSSAASQKDILSELARGDVSIKDSEWKELWVGTHHMRVR